jgi:hypothetical protein
MSFHSQGDSMKARTQRYMIWIGLAGGFIYFVTLWLMLGMIPPPSPGLDAAAVVQLYTHGGMVLRVGVVIMMTVSGFWLPLGAVISLQIARHEPGYPIWSVLQAMSSAVGAWIFAFPVLLWGTAAFTVTRNPEITLMLHEFSWLAFLSPICAFTFQLLPIIVVALGSKAETPLNAFPRWIGYLTIWMLAVGDLPVVIYLFKSGPFAWNGLVFWLALCGYASWTLPLSYALLRAISHQERSAKAAGQINGVAAASA